MMISCEKCQLHLAEYANEDLPVALVDEMACHLDACPDCRAELENEKYLRAELGAMPLVRCPEDVSDVILTAINKESAPPRHSRPDRWVWPAAGMVAAGLAVILMLPGQTPEPSPGPETTYSATEIQAASGQARLALARVADVLNSNEQSTIDQVFGKEIPTAVGASLLHLTKNLQGET